MLFVKRQSLGNGAAVCTVLSHCKNAGGGVAGSQISELFHDSKCKILNCKLFSDTYGALWEANTMKCFEM